jgi:hypothetical protein
MFARQPDGSVGIKSWVGTGWVPSQEGWNSLGKPDSGYFNAAISAVSWAKDRFHIFAPSSDGTLQAKAWSGTDWVPSRYTWIPLGGPIALDSMAMVPFWSTQVMYNESVLMVSPVAGKNPQAKLLWPASKILSVRDPSTGIEYQNGKDWLYDAATNTLSLPTGSRAVSMTESQL